MKNLIKISIFFALTILFTSSAYADSIDEYFQQIDRDQAAIQSCIARLPKPASPREWCQYYRSMDACNLDSYVVHRSGGEKIIESESGDDCTIIPDEVYKGTHHFYYSGNLFCSERSIGTPGQSKDCVPRTDITTIPKLVPAPESQSKTEFEIAQKNAVSLMNENKDKLEKGRQKINDMMRQRNEKDAANSQINQLQTFNDALKNLMENLGTSITKLKDWAGRIFDGVKTLFKK